MEAGDLQFTIPVFLQNVKSNENLPSTKMLSPHKSKLIAPHNLSVLKIVFLFANFY